MRGGEGGRWWGGVRRGEASVQDGLNSAAAQKGNPSPIRMNTCTKSVAIVFLGQNGAHDFQAVSQSVSLPVFHPARTLLKAPENKKTYHVKINSEYQHCTVACHTKTLVQFMPYFEDMAHLGQVRPLFDLLQLLRGTILSRTYGTHNTLHTSISQFFPTIFWPYSLWSPVIHL